MAIIDIDLPGMDGLTAAGLLHERLPECRALILTSLGRPGTLRRAMAAHVAGFLLKDAPPVNSPRPYGGSSPASGWSTPSWRWRPGAAARAR